MNPTPYLTDAEIAELTRPLKQHAAQRRALEKLGIPFRVRPDGSPLVWRWDRDAHQAKQSGQPRWSRAA